MTNTMAFAVSTPASSMLHSSSSQTGVKPSFFVSSNPAISIPKNATFQHVRGIPQLGFAPFSQWIGVKQTGISVSQYSVKIERKGKCKGKGVYASLFGVGATEALVIGVVQRKFQGNLRAALIEKLTLMILTIQCHKVSSPTPLGLGHRSWGEMSNPMSLQKRVTTVILVVPKLPCMYDEVSARREYSAALSLCDSPVMVLDDPQEPSFVMPFSEDPISNALQEEAVSAVPAPKPENNQ